MVGTMSFEDIYGAGTLDTVPAPEAAATSQKTNPNSQDVTGVPRKGEEGIQHLLKAKNLLGQPLVVWLGIVGLLIALKYFAER